MVRSVSRSSSSRPLNCWSISSTFSSSSGMTLLRRSSISARYSDCDPAADAAEASWSDSSGLREPSSRLLSPSLSPSGPARLSASLAVAVSYRLATCITACQSPASTSCSISRSWLCSVVETETDDALRSSSSNVDALNSPLSPSMSRYGSVFPAMSAAVFPTDFQSPALIASSRSLLRSLASVRPLRSVISLPVESWVR
mmetsp:Transcript_35165/g.83995  ORF Transcript_35165/g.83995 Transcript_35165/m.83995 type:complete len:200 (-) Transcript_35165:227-826(-)